MSTAQLPVAGRSGRLLALAATAALCIAGCGTGFGAQTNQPYDPGVGANERLATIDILGALVVTNDDGTGTVSATLVSQPGSTHVLDEVTAQTLDGDPIDAEVTGSFEVTSVPDPPQRLGDAATVVLSGDAFAPGDFVDVTFSFSDAEPFEIQMPVVARTDDGTYDGVAQAPAA